MINIVLNGAQLLIQCAALLYLMRIRRYLRSIDSGQEETNEYLSDIRRMHREAVNAEIDEKSSILEKLPEFMGG